MAALPPTVKPGWRINWGQSVSRRLAAFIAFPSSGNTINLVDGVSAGTSATTLIQTPYGQGISVLAEAGAAPSFAAGYTPIIASEGHAVGDFAMMVVANPPTTAPAGGINCLFSQRVGAGGSFKQVAVYCNSTYTDGGSSAHAGQLSLLAYDGVSDTGANTDATAVDGKWHVYIATRYNGIYDLYVDGKRNVAASTNTAVVWEQTSQVLRVGDLGAVDATDQANCSIALAAAWNRGLSSAEAQALTRDVWLPLRVPNKQIIYTFASTPPASIQTFASAFYDAPPAGPQRRPDYPSVFWNPRTVVNAAPPPFAIPPGLDAANPRAAARLVEYAASFWDPRIVVNAAPPAFTIPVLSDLPPLAAQRLVEYQAQAWNPLGGYTNPAPPAFAIPVLSDLPPRAAQRLVEYPSFFWDPRVIPAPPVTYAQSFYDLPPKVAQRLAEYQAAFWNPARFVNAAPPAFAIPVLTDLPPALQIPRRLVDFQAAFWNPLGGPFNGPPPAFAIPPGMDAATPRAAARLVEYVASFWNPRLVVNAAPPAFSIPSFTDVPKVAARPAFYEQPAWTPQPFDIRYASVFDQLPPYAQRRLVEYQAAFLALPLPTPPTTTPSALWQPQYPDILLPAARLPDYSFFVLPYADYGGSINPPVQTGAIPQPIYGFWINARKRARHIAKQTNVKAAINQEINRALADLKENDAAATERAFARILAAEAVLQQQKYLKGLLEAHALETRLVAARRAAELAQEEQDINDLLGKL